ncbi:MAG: VOC family protein [Actinobacteria bacterium]|nr:VOC family protein [Actinomycetota bacterium]
MAAKVVHFEIPADDTTRAREFWTNMFGVEFQSYDGPMEYHMFDNGDQTGGGLMPRMEGSDGLTIYFSTDDLDATLDKVRELGGTVETEKMPVAGMGWFAPAKDTEGNRFSFWQADENAPEAVGTQSGEASSS